MGIDMDASDKKEQGLDSKSSDSQTSEEHATLPETSNSLIDPVVANSDTINSSKTFPEDLTRKSSHEEPQPLEDATISVNLNNVGDKKLSAEKASSELNCGLVLDNDNSEALVGKDEIVAEEAYTLPAGTGKLEVNHPSREQSEIAVEDPQAATQEQMSTRPEDERNFSPIQLGLPPQTEAEKTSVKAMSASAENGFNNHDVKNFESPQENAAKKSRGRPKRTYAESAEGKHVSGTLGSSRVLRSTSQEKRKDPEPVINLQEHSAGPSGETRRKRKKKKQMKNAAVDEFSRTRSHLRYLLHRMAYEQNLIDAYSGEGWKGQSIEKLRPEKELQRAKSEIFRCKLKIRDLFQRIDSSIAEGRIPQSLFDSEGEIDSEDIFCAKCGLKDVTLENDIILCDGACERAFHQFCVQPPLLKEDIPPDDEGWLCPGCDCKDDCFDLINESQGTKLSILDSWEKVYPEAAAAAAAGKILENNLNLPSDDSEDNDYKPDDSAVDEKDEEGESSSEESDDSENSGVSPENKQDLQLPSDDSEDDDFDPDAVDVDVDHEAKQESSSSDFTSDSEDLTFAVDANGPLHEDLAVPSEFVSESSKVGRGKRLSINEELSSLLETTTSQGESAPIYSKREVERLDYKKLYDEEYGNVSTDPSDEEFTDPDAPKRRRKNITDSGKAPKKRVRKKPDTVDASPTKLNRVPSEPGSSQGNSKRTPPRRFGEAATQALLKSFKENHYPERATKEKLAKEFGITLHQVSRWFENARWSFRHSSYLETKLAEIPIENTPNQEYQSEVNTADDMVKADSRMYETIDDTTVPQSSPGSPGAQQKVQKRGRPRGRSSLGPKASKRIVHRASNNDPSDNDVSKAQVKRRGRPKKSGI